MNAGKHALVTGGMRGIGLEICKALLRTNLEKLCVADLQDHIITMDTLRNDFPSKTIIYQKCDVSKPDELEICYKSMLTKFDKIDIVVNNAGILDDTNCKKTLLVNLSGLITSSLLGMKYMSKDNGGSGGHIINISSTAGLGPTYYLPIYSASKEGVVGFTRCMGYHDYYFKKTGVKFMVICPGISMTNINNNIEDKLALKEFKKIFDREVVAKAVYQDIAATGLCVLKALARDQNGSVFICDQDKIKEVTLKEFTQDFVTKDLKA